MLVGTERSSPTHLKLLLGLHSGEPRGVRVPRARAAFPHPAEGAADVRLQNHTEIQLLLHQAF